MGLETATYINELNASNPTSADPKSAGDDHLRLTKYVLKMTFPNVTGAITATHTELNYVDGVTSSIQGQFAAVQVQFTGVQSQFTAFDAAKGNVAGQVWTGAHNFSASTSFLVPTPTLSGQAVNKGYADALAFASALPAQTGNSGKAITTDGTTASWIDPAAFEGLRAADLATSATPNIWSGLGKLVLMTGAVTVTGFTAAPRAGAGRTLIAATGFAMTNGANLIIRGGSITLAAGDQVDVIALTTTSFYATVTRADGTPVATRVIHYSAGASGALDYRNGQSQVWTPVSGPKTLTVSNWPAAGTFAEMRVKIINGGAGGVPTITGAQYVKVDGTFGATAASAGITFQTSGIDFVLLFTDDGGANVYVKVMR